MPYLLIHEPSGRIVATVDRDDIPAWLGLVELPVSDAPNYRTEKIPPMTLLPKRRTSIAARHVWQPDSSQRPTPIPPTRVS